MSMTVEELQQRISELIRETIDAGIDEEDSTLLYAVSILAPLTACLNPGQEDELRKMSALVNNVSKNRAPIITRISRN